MLEWKARIRKNDWNPPLSYDCFISYQSGDLGLAEQVHQGLTAAGIDPGRIWFDRKRLQPGFEWHKEIEAGCESSRILLPVLTPRWQQSQWTRFETYGAEVVVPLRFEGDFEAVATPPLKRFQAQEINFTTGNVTDSWARLAASIRELLQRPQPLKTERVSLLRYHHNPHFLGREQELLAIHQHLHDRPTTDLTQGKVHVIAALGGMGKTTLAREYAEKFWRCYVAIFWVDARNPAGIEAEYADLYTTLHPETAADVKQAERAGRMLQLLKGREERLLIVDNAEDEASVRRWLPNVGGCRVLVTSRFSDWPAAVGVTALETLGPAAACKLLRERSGMPEPAAADSAAVEELARALGFLPLALEQAAAYMRKQRMGYARYLKRFNEEAAQLLQKGALGSTEYPDAVMTTWAATIARMPSTSRALLRLSAFMAATPIPREFFVRAAGTVRIAEGILREQEMREATPPAESDDRYLIDEALGHLADHSMLSLEEETFQVHGLVQTVERVNLPLPRFAEWSIGALLFLDSCPDDPSDPDSWSLLRQTALHLDHISHAGWTAAENLNQLPQEARNVSPIDIFVRVLKLLTYLGKYHAAVGNHVAAERYLRLALDNDGRVPPDKHRTIQSLRSLSDLLIETDRLGEAIQLREREVAFYEREADPGDPVVARPLCRLADALVAAGRYEEAEQLLDKALQIARQGDDVSALTWQRECLVSLMGLYNETGREADHGRIRHLYLEIGRRLPLDMDSPFAVGDPHLESARAAQLAGDMSAFEESLQRYLKAGASAPTATPDILAHFLSTAASQYRQAGQSAKAEPLLQQALTHTRSVYGDMSGETAEALCELARVYDDLDKTREAADTWRAALRIREHLFPEGHSSIAETLLSLAKTVSIVGDAEDPEPLMRRALGLFERTRGKDHGLTGDCCAQLAYVLARRSSIAEAVDLMERTITIKEKQYGPVSADVGNLLRGWERTLRNAGRFSEAADVGARSLALHEKLYGMGSIELLRDLYAQFFLAREQANLQAAEHTLIRGLKIVQDATPNDIARLAEWRMQLGLFYAQTGRPAEAEDFLRAGIDHSFATGALDQLFFLSALALIDALALSDRLPEAEPLALHVLHAALKRLGDVQHGGAASANDRDLQAGTAYATEAWMSCRYRAGVNPEEIQSGLVALFQEHSQLPLLETILERIRSRT